MKNRFIIIFLLSNFFILGSAEAQSSSGLGNPIPANSAISEDVGMLPTNPFYFLKELGRSFQRLITFNPVKKAKLELTIANEKAAEIKKLEEVRPNDLQAIKSAVQSYKDSQKQFLEKIDALNEASQTPQSVEFLESLPGHLIEQGKNLESVSGRLRDRPEDANVDRGVVFPKKEEFKKILATSTIATSSQFFSKSEIEKELLESECGLKISLPLTPENCKYEGPICADKKWQYKLDCWDASSTPAMLAPEKAVKYPYAENSR